VYVLNVYFSLVRVVGNPFTRVLVAMPRKHPQDHPLSPLSELTYESTPTVKLMGCGPSDARTRVVGQPILDFGGNELSLLC